MFTFTTFCLFNVSSKYIQEQAPEMFFKKPEVLQYSQQSICVRAFGLQIFYKETLTQVFSCKYCNFTQKSFQHRSFNVNTAKFLRTPILKDICEQLLLYIHHNWCVQCWCCFAALTADLATFTSTFTAFIQQLIQKRGKASIVKYFKWLILRWKSSHWSLLIQIHNISLLCLRKLQPQN